MSKTSMVGLAIVAVIGYVAYKYFFDPKTLAGFAIVAIAAVWLWNNVFASGPIGEKLVEYSGVDTSAEGNPLVA